MLLCSGIHEPTIGSAQLPSENKTEADMANLGMVHGSTSLYAEILRGSVDSVWLLIENKAHVNKRSRKMVRLYS